MSAACLCSWPWSLGFLMQSLQIPSLQDIETNYAEILVRRVSFVKFVLSSFPASPNRWLPKDFLHPTQEPKTGVKGKIIWAIMHRLDKSTWFVCSQITQTSLKLNLYCLVPEHFEEQAEFIWKRRASFQINISLFYFLKLKSS